MRPTIERELSFVRAMIFVLGAAIIALAMGLASAAPAVSAEPVAVAAAKKAAQCGCSTPAKPAKPRTKASRGKKS